MKKFTITSAVLLVITLMAVSVFAGVTITDTSSGRSVSAHNIWAALQAFFGGGVTGAAVAGTLGPSGEIIVCNTAGSTVSLPIDIPCTQFAGTIVIGNVIRTDSTINFGTPIISGADDTGFVADYFVDGTTPLGTLSFDIVGGIGANFAFAPASGDHTVTSNSYKVTLSGGTAVTPMMKFATDTKVFPPPPKEKISPICNVNEVFGDGEIDVCDWTVLTTSSSVMVEDGQIDIVNYRADPTRISLGDIRDATKSTQSDSGNEGDVEISSVTGQEEERDGNTLPTLDAVLLAITAFTDSATYQWDETDTDLVDNAVFALQGDGSRVLLHKPSDGTTELEIGLEFNRDDNIVNWQLEHKFFGSPTVAEISSRIAATKADVFSKVCSGIDKSETEIKGTDGSECKVVSGSLSTAATKLSTSSACGLNSAKAEVAKDKVSKCIVSVPDSSKPFGVALATT